MNQVSYNDAWRASIDDALKVKKNQWGTLAGYPGAMKWTAEQGGRFACWDTLYSAGGFLENDLASSVDIGCVYRTHEYCLTYLAWANEAADRALSDVRFTLDPEEERLKGNADPLAKRGWKIPGIFPGNHGAILVCACFARGLRDNSALDEASLLQAADEIAVSAQDGGSKMWDYIAQSQYLRCVRLSLVAGDVNKAQFFLKNIRRKFKHTFEHQQWLQTLANTISESAGKPLETDARQHFQAYFDRIRDPDCQLPSNQPGGFNLHANLSILRLELAIIKQRYMLAQPLAGSWLQVLALISE